MTSHPRTDSLFRPGITFLCLLSGSCVALRCKAPPPPESQVKTKNFELPPELWQPSSSKPYEAKKNHCYQSEQISNSATFVPHMTETPGKLASPAFQPFSLSKTNPPSCGSRLRGPRATSQVERRFRIGQSKMLASSKHNT
eukprot:2449908-Amphidinium_carterae.1